MDYEESKVWQRVAAGPRSIRETKDTQELLRTAAETEAFYRSLMGQLPGAGRLHREQQETVRCLSGILMIQGEQLTRLWYPGSRQPAEKLLKQLYLRALGALGEYMARSADSRFGCAYRVLAQREENQCARILTLLGGLTNRK